MAAAAVGSVLVWPAEQLVVAGAAPEVVVTGATVQVVVAAASDEDVVAASPTQHVVASGADEPVVARGADGGATGSGVEVPAGFEDVLGEEAGRALDHVARRRRAVPVPTEVTRSQGTSTCRAQPQSGRTLS